MKIQTVTVEIHEKRNHPHEYGHYDSRVSYTAQLDEGEQAAQVVESLQFQARQQVAIECDRWIADVERKKEIEKARDDLRWAIQRAGNNAFSAEQMTKFNEKVQILPAEERDYYWTQLNKAIGQYRQEINEDLDRLIEGAKKHKRLPSHDSVRFDLLLDNLSESDQADYRARMDAAIAPLVEVPLAENEEDIAF